MSSTEPGRFCSQDGRGWTDLYTNLVLFKDVELSRHLGAILAPERYRLPRELAPGFIHEATHHWCFNSTVGAALAALQLRAQRRLTALASGIRAFSPQAVGEDMLRVDVAEECLRPLSEGLALFAEFDVTPRDSSPKVSLPMWWAHYFFSNFDRDDVNTGALEMLDSVRSSPAMERRRRGILIHDCTGNLGGYLPGYLAVKQMWLMAVNSDRRFWNRDLFLMFLKSFLFADMELTTILLDPDRPGNSAERIVNHMESRLASLWKLDLTTALDDFIAALRLGGARTQGPHLLVAVDPSVAAKANQLLEAIIRETREFPSRPPSKWEALCMRDGLTFARRDLMRLGSLDAIATVRDGELFLEEGGEPLLTLDLRPGAAFPEPTNVEVDVEASPAFDNVIVFVWHDEKMVGQGFIRVPGGEGDAGETRNNTQADLYVGSRRDQDAYYSESRKRLDRLVPAEARQQARASVRAEFIDFLSELALGQTPIPLRAQVWKTMASDGIAALVNDTTRIQQLSRIGLASSITSNRPLVLEQLATMGITEDDVRSVVAAGRAANVPFVLVQGDVLVTIT
jgi:hypothetical protein